MSSPTTEVPKPETRPKLPEGWRWVRLGSIGSLINGNAFKTTDWSKTGLPIIRIQNLNDETKPFNYWAGPTKDRVLVQPGDLLLAWSGTPGTSFGAHIWRRGEAVLNQHIFRVDLDQEIIDTSWAMYAINYRLHELVDSAQGAVGLRHVTKSQVEALELPLPPLETQRRIATILTEQMGAVEKARKAAEDGLEAARELPEACLRSAFPTVPITVNTAPAPKGWRWTLLTDFARLESGHTPSRRREEWWGGDIPWISLSDIRALDGKTAIQTREYTNPEGIANSSARVLPAGTVVLSRTASVGFVTVMGRPMATSQDFVNWVCGPELEPWYLAYALMASREYIRSLGSGAVHQTVYVPVVQRFRLLHPNLETQHRIVAELNAKLEATQALIRSLEAQLEAIRALPAAILRRAFSGEL